MIDENSNIIGMINARGGSKGIPRKNIKPLNGIPLIGWSVETAKKVPELSRTIISTEDDEIARVARDLGGDVPFMRPDDLAQDSSVQMDTIIYNVERLEKETGARIDAVALLQPTHPFRLAEDVSGCIQKMIESGADTVITVAPNKHHPQGIWRQSEGQKGISLFLEDSSKAGFNRQQVEDLYFRTGAVYLMSRETILEKKSLYGDHVEGYIVDDIRSWINIDEPQDWELAEAWLKHKNISP